MDVAIFSKCLKDLLLQHDEVVVPGLGAFLARTVYAREASDGSFTPPQRKISFSPARKEDDGLFLRFLKRYLPDGSDAAEQLQSFVMDLFLEADIARPVNLPGLGILKANARKTFYFVPTEEIFVYPESLQGDVEPDIDSLPADEADLSPEAGAAAASAAAERAPFPGTAARAAAESAAQAAVQGIASPQRKGGSRAVASENGTPANHPAATGDGAADRSAGTEARRGEPADGPRSILIGNCLLMAFVLLIFAMIAVTLFKDTPWMSNLLDHLLYTREELEILGK